MSVGLLWIGFSCLLTFEQTVSEAIPRIVDGLIPYYSERFLLPLLMAVGFWIAARRIARGAPASRARSHGESAVLAYNGALFIMWPLVAFATIAISGETATYKHSRSLERVHDASPIAWHLAVLAFGILLLAWSEYKRTAQ